MSAFYRGADPITGHRHDPRPAPFRCLSSRSSQSQAPEAGAAEGAGRVVSYRVARFLPVCDFFDRRRNSPTGNAKPIPGRRFSAGGGEAEPWI